MASKWWCALALGLGLAGFALVAMNLYAVQDVKPKEKPGLFDRKPKPPPGVSEIDDLIKNLPEGLDPKEREKLKKDLEKLKKQLEEAKQPGGGLPFPGGDKGFPFAGDKGFPFPGGDKGFPFPGDKGGFPFPVVPAFPGFPGGKQGPGRLGIEVTPPSDVLAEQLQLPTKKGLVIEKVVADSAAAKAGLKKNDILIEFGGKAVPSDPKEFRKVISDWKTDEPAEAQVIRKGKKEMIKEIKLPEPKKEDTKGFPGFPGGDKGGFPGFPGGDKGGFPGGFPGLPGMNPFGGGAQPVPILHREERWSY